jgi:hypothetical protein
MVYMHEDELKFMRYFVQSKHTYLQELKEREMEYMFRK